VSKANFVTADLLVTVKTKGMEKRFFPGPYVGWREGNILFKYFAVAGGTEQANHHVVFIQRKQ
jgi:hypothetical protein